MKILAVLSIVQIAAILFLYSKLIDIDKKMKLTAVVAEDTFVSDSLANTQSQAYSNDIYQYPNEDRLRQIIREELSAQGNDQSGLNKQVDAAIASNSRNTVENEYQRELVAQQLEYYMNVGSISNVDMQKLQGEIARLDEAGRKEMLRKLTRALNSGELDGRL